jgi:3-oxoacyl-[acyl-carrier protein] reductase
MSSSADQTAVVTGRAQGLGLAITERSVADEAQVGLKSVSLAATGSAAKCPGDDDITPPVRCDSTAALHVDTLLATAGEQLSGLDVSVNKAQITQGATMGERVRYGLETLGNNGGQGLPAIFERATPT